MTDPPSAREPLDAARQLGVELDVAETRRWLLAVAGADERQTIAADEDLGVFGERVAMLDFDPEDLDRLRRLVPQVRLVRRPDVESAIAISGSSAQGKVQLFPGDADFFERMHVHAPTRSDAEQIVRSTLRATAMRAFTEPDIVLVEANLGTYREPVIERGRDRAAGDPITWTPEDVAAGEIVVDTTTGGTHTIRWDDTDVGGGWVYLGWIAADRDAGRIALVSVMIDATWEDPAGVVHALDGAIDPVAQEIYLEGEALALVERLQAVVASDGRRGYRAAMQSEAYHYTHVEPNFAKAAKRLYNLFRVADELEAAAFVRELFDEPSAQLYQVPGLLEAANVALDPDSGIDRDTVLRQLDAVATAIVESTDGPTETDLLAQLAGLRAAALDEGETGTAWSTVLADVQARSRVLVNDFFRERLLGYERVRALIDALEPE